MDFAEYMQSWVKNEVTQGKIMIGIGVLMLVALFFILRGQNELLKGTLIPLSLLMVVLIGYGGYILYSRPAHAQQSVALYKQSKEEAIQKEIEKHVNDNKAGKTLIRFVYPSLLLISAILLFAISSPYYKGVALGVALLAISTYIIDTGFVTRSDAFISFLNKLS